MAGLVGRQALAELGKQSQIEGLYFKETVSPPCEAH